MRYYPIFVNLENKRCLVVGAGEVGVRKIETLLDRGAGAVTVIDTREPEGALADIAARENVAFHCRGFTESDLDGMFLVIASTSSEDVNWRISNLCHERGILCNIVDQPEKCSFIVPAMVRQGDLTVAISTGGRSPALAKRIRKGLQESFGDEYGRFLVLMGELRPLVLGLDRPTSENTALFRGLVNSGLMEALAANDADRARDVLRDALPVELHANIPELLHGFV